MPEWVDLLAACLALGMLHGVIPDEHTWPITFSYSVGAASGRGGIRSGSFFALAFTLQRAAMSQLVFYAFAVFLISNTELNGPVYLAVGAAMAIAGYLILANRLPHWRPVLRRYDESDLPKHEREIAETGNVPAHWAAIHGFIAGFGVDTGLFTSFVYLIAVPTMPSAWLGWAPGAAFGFGTFLVLIAIGLFFGGVLGVAKRWGAPRVERFGRLVGARVLLFGGIAFVLAGAALLSGLAAGVRTDFGTVLVVLVMVVIALPVMVLTWREVRRDLPTAVSVPSGPAP